MKKFGEVLEAADALSLDEQEDLVSVLQRRVVEQRREELAGFAEQARTEFKAGRLRPASPDQIVKRMFN